MKVVPGAGETGRAELGPCLQEGFQAHFFVCLLCRHCLCLALTHQKGSVLYPEVFVQ